MRFLFFISILASFCSAHALEKIRCTVFDSTGAVISSPQPFPAHSTRLLKVTDQKFVEVRWTFFKSPVRVALLFMPNAPFAIPTQQLGRAEIGFDSTGKINGVVDLNALQPGTTLSCL